MRPRRWSPGKVGPPRSLGVLLAVFNNNDDDNDNNNTNSNNSNNNNIGIIILIVVMIVIVTKISNSPCSACGLRGVRVWGFGLRLF